MVSLSAVRVFYTEALLSWGFVVRHRGASAAQPAYVLPPPTTVVGAFAYPLARILGLNPNAESEVKWGDGRLISSTMKVFLEATIAAAAGVRAHPHRTGLATAQEPGRIIASPYKGDTERGRIKTEPFESAIPRAMPVQGVGATYAPGVTVGLAWAIDGYKLAKELGIQLEKLDAVAEKAPFGVVRLGSKEGFLAVDYSRSMYVKNVKLLGPGDKFRTWLYVDSTCVDPLDQAYVHQLPMPDLSYRLKRYYVPSQLASHNVVVPLPEHVLPLFKLVEPCGAIQAPEVEGLVVVMSHDSSSYPQKGIGAEL
ncbi:CRISPR-associated protein Cas5 [Infirmifilum sp.]|uniref:CRISPR-associated protein Cas5 n=1 Tax=Infirmifilum sp. TaxID=2856575 RepID=UPI003D134BC1